MTPQRMPLNVPLAIIIFAAVTAVALRAEGQATTMTADRPDIARHGISRPSAIPSNAAGSSEQMQYVFHELHPHGRHALCAVCESQYRY